MFKEQQRLSEPQQIASAACSRQSTESEPCNAYTVRSQSMLGLNLVKNQAVHLVLKLQRKCCTKRPGKAWCQTVLLCQPRSSSFALCSALVLRPVMLLHWLSCCTALVSAQQGAAPTKTKEITLSIVPDALYGKQSSSKALLVTQDAD